ncbi:helix-turn-helix domain-containing protein [Spirosoma daeguense]
MYSLRSDLGVMSFMAPDQIVTWHPDDVPATEGWLLIFHTHFIRNYPLGHKIREYGFFGYAVHEALILSEEEEQTVENLILSIRQESQARIDTFSQDVIVSQLDLLLTYCNRFYSRQFITRKTANNDLLSKVETLLADYFDQDKAQLTGLPTVTYLAERLNMSPKYLSDMLRNLTGQSAQQHIHDKLIDKAKEILVTTNLSVGEIAYQLGFECPQSFNKLFKNKTNVSPLEFRQSFN